MRECVTNFKPLLKGSGIRILNNLDNLRDNIGIGGEKRDWLEKHPSRKLDLYNSYLHHSILSGEKLGLPKDMKKQLQKKDPKLNGKQSMTEGREKIKKNIRWTIFEILEEREPFMYSVDVVGYDSKTGKHYSGTGVLINEVIEDVTDIKELL